MVTYTQILETGMWTYQESCYSLHLSLPSSSQRIMSIPRTACVLWGLRPLHHPLKAQNFIFSHRLESPKSNWETFIMIQGLGRTLHVSQFFPRGPELYPLGPWFCPLSLKLYHQRCSDSFLKIANVCKREIVSYCLLFAKESISKYCRIWGAQWPLFILSFLCPFGSSWQHLCLYKALKNLVDLPWRVWGLTPSDKIIHGSLVDNPTSISGFCWDNWENPWDTC